MPEHDFYRIFIQPIEKLNIEYMVTGAIAAISKNTPPVKLLIARPNYPLVG